MFKHFSNSVIISLGSTLLGLVIAIPPSGCSPPIAPNLEAPQSIDSTKMVACRAVEPRRYSPSIT